MTTTTERRSSSVRALLIAFSVAVAVLVSGVVSAAPAAAATTGAETQFISKLNGARVARGIQRLAMRSVLVAVARAQATRMANRDTLYHNPNLTSDVRNWRWVGENVGYGPDAPVIHTAFMNSPAHKANILDRDYTEVGIGVVVRNGRVWVAEVFRRPARTTAVQGTKVYSASTTWRTLRLGSKGAAVKRVQQRLGLRQTGYYGAGTRRAVLRFQARRGWRPVGVVGPLTRRALRV
jgi:uncharacterized protein YkwD